MIVNVYDIKGRAGKLGQGISEDIIHQPLVTEKRHKHSFAFGDAEIVQLSFAGIYIKYGDVAVHEHMNLHMEMEDEPSVVELHFTLSGQGTLRHDRNGQHYNFIENQCNMHYLPQFAGGGEYRKNMRYRFFEVHFTTSAFLALAENSSPLLMDLAEKISGNSLIQINKQNMPMTLAMHQCIQDILYCQFTGGLKMMYLQSKCVELLALQTQAYENLTGKSPFAYSITAEDIERIHYAQTYLLQHALEPPSLIQLARIAGINEFKLKKGFREVFNNTVYGYLADHKLHEAKEMLLSKQTPIKDVADQLGYSSVQHFSKAFKKKFGISPGQAK
ncbi:helix-turn-helix domain-containing protein [Chitinophaga sp. SYP-B3965]|uniref:helix-turn-helix transcriptional regulator n=1 Tax=Chitinophaga sp. SYP-B3965 TaxID=2663120 RepID=UPI001299A35E|nr:AraC family transcriptional regulator [Chitinophaga sp. SYP-B3965]MRG47999.1 helix-turn-helix domain-containing protein [Chitinophaga sp. SYP-B3965]